MKRSKGSSECEGKGALSLETLRETQVITKLSGAARASATGDGEDLRMRAAIAEALRERMGDRTLVDQVKHDALHRLRRQDAQR